MVDRSDIETLPDICPVCNHCVADGYFFCCPEDGSKYQLFCEACEYEGEWYSTLEEAITEWNKLIRIPHHSSKVLH